MSVTYGAGGSTSGKTIEIVKRIKDEYGLEAMAHFTCVGATVPELRATLDEMRAAGIDNVLALRGDPPAGQEAWRQDRGGPRVLTRTRGADHGRLPLRDRRRLLPGDPHPRGQPRGRPRPIWPRRWRPGVDFLITQLFFDNALYFDFVARARAAGIEVPIIPGIMPITQVGQVERMATMCGASIPDGLRRELHAREDQPEAVLDFGVAYATLQCAELLERGRARHPLLHAQPLARHARDPERAEAGAAVGAGALPRFDLQALGHPGSRRPPRSARPPSRSGGRCPRPTRRAASGA